MFKKALHCTCCGVHYICTVDCILHTYLNLIGLSSSGFWGKLGVMKNLIIINFWEPLIQAKHSENSSFSQQPAEEFNIFLFQSHAKLISINTHLLLDNPPDWCRRSSAVWYSSWSSEVYRNRPYRWFSPFSLWCGCTLERKPAAGKKNEKSMKVIRWSGNFSEKRKNYINNGKNCAQMDQSGWQATLGEIEQGVFHRFFMPGT